jgi:MYXO-CTERM domain-containing protein
MSCDDGSACSQTDTCQVGVCTGSNPIACPAPDQCHSMGTCNAATGVCSNPAKADSSSCDDGNACTQTDLCQAGLCTAGIPVVCSASDDCHDVGLCDTMAGACSNPAKADGTMCSLGACQAGVCTAVADAGADGGTGGQGGGSATTATGSGVGGTGGIGGGSAATTGSGVGETSSSSTGAGGSPPPKVTSDLGCGCTIPGGATSPRAAWLGAIALLALARRRIAPRRSSSRSL